MLEIGTMEKEEMIDQRSERNGVMAAIVRLVWEKDWEGRIRND